MALDVSGQDLWLWVSRLSHYAATFKMGNPIGTTFHPVLTAPRNGPIGMTFQWAGLLRGPIFNALALCPNDLWLRRKWPHDLCSGIAALAHDLWLRTLADLWL
jgi:hypothetical protein